MLQCDLTIIIEVVTHMAEHGELLVTVRYKATLLASLLDSALDHCFGDHGWFPLADEHSITPTARDCRGCVTVHSLALGACQSLGLT